MSDRSTRPQRQGPLTHRFPSWQLSVLATCRLCEPIAFVSIFPYNYYMIESFNITQNDDQIAFYAGMITSAFAFAEAVSSMLWGRLSDRVGRKPVLLVGLAGTGLSMFILGFANSLPLAIFARCLGGLLNGNVGVIQATVAEMVKVEAHQRNACILGLTLCLGSRCCHRFSHRRNPRRPSQAETHEEKRKRYDPGLLVGEWILNLNSLSSRNLRNTTVGGHEDEQKLPFLADDAGSHCIAGTPSLRSVLTNKDILLAFLGYGILAFHTICIETLLPLFYEMPGSDAVPTFPFKFTGGLELSTKTVGFIISGEGLISMLVQILIYPVVSRKLSTIALFRWTCFGYPIFHFAIPYLVALPHHITFYGIFVVMVIKVALGAFLVPSMQIILVNSTPSRQVLGTVNGSGASIATVCRGLGPILSGAIQNEGLKSGYVGMAWWFLSAIAVLGYVESLYITVTGPRRTASSTGTRDSVC